MTAVAFEYGALEPEGELVVAGGATPLSRAAEIVAAAQVEAQRIAAEAEIEGREAGYAAGLAAAHAELAEARTALGEATASVLASRDELLAAAERSAVELAVVLAEKIVAASVEVRPELVLEVVSSGLRRVAGAGRVVLDVNPDDLELVRDAVNDLVLLQGGPIDVVAERRVARGGCVVRTTEGDIDLRVDAQLDSARAVLVESMRG